MNNFKLVHHGILPYANFSETDKALVDKQIKTLIRKNKFDDDYDDVYTYKGNLIVLKPLSNDTLFVNLLGRWKIQEAAFVIETCLGHLRKIQSFVFPYKNEMLVYHSLKHRNISRRRYDIYHKPQTDVVIHRRTSPLRNPGEPLATKFKVTLYDEADDVLNSQIGISASIIDADHYEYMVFEKPMCFFTPDPLPVTMPIDIEFYSCEYGGYISLKKIAWNLGYTKHNMPVAGKTLSNAMTSIIPCNSNISCVSVKGLRLPKFPNDNPVFDSSTTHILQVFADLIS